MSTENSKQKLTAAEKITSILNKLSIPEATEAWKQAGDGLHKRIMASIEGRKPLS